MDGCFPASTLENFINENVYAKPRFMLVALVVCAGVGLMLSVIGTFSVTAYSVSLRTHEIGVRVALGAQRSAVLALILKTGMKLVGKGIMLGFAASLLVASIADRLFWRESAVDVLTVLSSLGLLAIAGLMACYLPALKATRVDASTALRSE
jgi:putative ABC transport system permease protein